MLLVIIWSIFHKISLAHLNFQYVLKAEMWPYKLDKVVVVLF